MEPRLIPPLIASLAFFGMVVICPLVMLFLRHQRLMAEMFRDKSTDETAKRLELVERELRELKALRHEQVLRDDDERALSHRVT